MCEEFGCTMRIFLQIIMKFVGVTISANNGSCHKEVEVILKMKSTGGSGNKESEQLSGSRKEW